MEGQVTLPDGDTVLDHLKVPTITQAEGEKGQACSQSDGCHGDKSTTKVPAKVPEGEFNDHHRPLPIASTGLILVALKRGYKVTTKTTMNIMTTD